MVGQGITECLRDLFTGHSINHLKPLSLLAVELDKASFRAALTDLSNNVLDKVCLGFLGGVRSIVCDQHRLHNAGQSKIPTMLVTHFTPTNDHVLVAWTPTAAKVSGS
jgi:hypothetical protein